MWKWSLVILIRALSEEYVNICVGGGVGGRVKM